MSKHTNLKILSLILLAIVLSFSITTATYTPTGKVNFKNNLNGYIDRCTVGVGDYVTDDYDPAVDVMHPQPLPSGKDVQIVSIVSGEELTVDYRLDLEPGIPKTWQLTLKAIGASSGTNTLTWDYDFPKKVKLTLIDYGTDSTRTDVIEEIDMKGTSTYTFDVSEVAGPYRYIDMVAGIGNTKNPKKNSKEK
jgi:hypothetical protein